MQAGYNRWFGSSSTRIVRSLSVFAIAATFALGGFFAINSANAVISSITVTGPTVGQHLNDGVNITWTAVGTPGDLVDIYYSDNDFSTSTKLTTSGLAYDAGSYNWDTVAAGIPDDTDYKIKVKSTTNDVEGISAAFRIDNTAPTITTVTTYDSDTNGTVDKATIVFSELVDDSDFEADDFTIDGQAGVTIESTNDGSTADDNTFDVTFTTVVGTGVKSLIHTADGGNDMASPGNALATVTVVATDAAKPVFLSAQTKTTTRIDTTWSENINGTTVNDSGTEFTVTGFAVSAADDNSDNVVELTVATMPTDATPDVTFTNTGTFTDLAGNQAVTPTTRTATDGTAPTLSAVHIQSNNANTAFAKVGDTIIVSFTSSETISTPTVTIAGHASVTPTASHPGADDWQATYVMVSGDTEGLVTFSIAFSDTVGNPGVAVSTVGDVSSVTFDKTNPLVAITTPAVDSVTTVNNVTGVFVVSDTNAVTCAYTVTVDHVGSAAIACAGASITALTDGRRVLALTATDAAGNFTTTNSSFVVNLDTNLTVGSGKDFTTIQAAVNGATTGDDITIDTGAYPEAVTIASKDLDLIGSGGAVTATSFTLASTTVSGSTDVTAPTVQVNASAKITDGVLLSSSVLNIGSGTFTDNFTIDKDLTVTCGVGGGTTTQTKGIVITANGVTVNNCTFSGNIAGDAFINLDSDTAHSGISLTNNTFSGAITTWHLIRAGGNKTDLTITGNTFTGSTSGTDNAMILLGVAGDNIDVSNNSFSSFPSTYGFVAIQQNASGGARTTDLTIDSNTFDYTGYANGSGSEAISVRYASHVVVTNNILTGSASATTYEAGITLASVNSTGGQSVISGNTVDGFSRGIRIQRWASGDGNSDDIEITNNAVTDGVVLTGSESSTGVGLFLAGVTNLFVDENTVTGHTNAGVYIPATVSDGGANTITNMIIGGSTASFNDFSSNTDGMDNFTTTTASAQYNWWGSSTGPNHSPENIPGVGSSVSDYVDYSPWCTNSSCTTFGSSDPIDHFDIDPSAGSAIVNVLITLTVTAKDSADITRVNDTSVVSMAADHGASLGTLLLTLISGTRDTTVTNSVTGTVNVSGIKVGGSATGSTSVSFTSSDPDAPTIISHSPADDATDVAVTTVPYITFSEALKASTVNSTNIQLKKYSDNSNVSATVSLVEGGTRVNITPDSSLANNTQYYFAVSTSVQDEAGNALVTALDVGSRDSHEFTTVAIEPVVVDEIVAESSTATADDTYINGWHYIYRITVNTDETDLSVKFTDWDNADTTDTIAANGNMRVLFNSVTANGLGAVVGLTDSDIEDGFGDVDSYAIGNDYTDQSPSVIDISGLDTSSVRDGRQVQFDVYTKLPVTTVPGFYTTTYGIQVN
ncbi:MAG: hypothetical protein A3F25_00235 [Candidatus Yanofskybacteria bacterium RIFCSPHIGHO2_12_FULL_45_19b]|uniref:SbsA Ig-like domain-containing protein n=3 Tax=Patescibacteria group TaxID=1783273 RepID=A0A1F8G2F1_9BACT|nr:MAG: hypothetical protein A3F25_00235 [Candidatus Yanofskybacteria bacterium RIFCSPHIGHO2_12_FULL_45_19b]